MADTLSKAERSERMSRVRSKGNRSTEGRVAEKLAEYRIGDWTSHPKDVTGTPDFYFPKAHLAVFVDGCFWHACPRCGRIPKSRVEFWTEKIDANRRRDNRVRRRLWREGFHVLRIWEHDVPSGKWLPRLRRMLSRYSGE